MNILIVEDDDYKYKNMVKDLKVIVEDLNIFRLNNCMDALMYFRSLKNNSDNDYDYSVLYEPTKSLQEDFSKIIDDINRKENDLKDEKILRTYIK